MYHTLFKSLGAKAVCSVDITKEHIKFGNNVFKNCILMGF